MSQGCSRVFFFSGNTPEDTCECFSGEIPSETARPSGTHALLLRALYKEVSVSSKTEQTIRGRGRKLGTSVCEGGVLTFLMGGGIPSYLPLSVQPATGLLTCLPTLPPLTVTPHSLVTLSEWDT